jgi:glutamate synthase (NADPH/NADH) large chain
MSKKSDREKISNNHSSGSCGVGFVCNVSGVRSNEIIRCGIEAVRNLTHRGAVGADGKTGDGAGVLFQLPKKFLSKIIDQAGFKLSHIDNLAVGSFFLQGDVEQKIENTLQRLSLKTIGWRDVPTDDDALGQSALSTKPRISQLFIDTIDVEPEKIELKLFLARRSIEKEHSNSVYISSLSSKIIVYKGMLVATNLDRFYCDLADEYMESAFCVFHQRFSTNTSPDWKLAQPFRVLAHNGEINTIQGNRNWMVSIEHEIQDALSNLDGEKITPLVSFEESDSASLDRILELLMLSGFSPEHAVSMCVPPALECCDFDETTRRRVEAFFEYQSFLMKPWDGPAAIVFTDGDTVGAHLDRNGLRPLRYTRTEDDIFILGSETGMVDLGEIRIKERGRLGPGETISIKTGKGSIRFTHEILKDLSEKKPYGEWIDRFLLKIEETEIRTPVYPPDITRKQAAFGYTEEEIQTSLKEMAQSGKEMT